MSNKCCNFLSRQVESARRCVTNTENPLGVLRPKLRDHPQVIDTKDINRHVNMYVFFKGVNYSRMSGGLAYVVLTGSALESPLAQ
ncbi:hypothetical protein Hanom_Chr02g00138751 [Helianthus anomalus]